MAQNINVNMMPKNTLPEFRLSEGDVGRNLVATILDDSGGEYSIPEGATVTFVGTKPSGLGFTIPCTYSGNVVSLVSEATMDNEPGRFDCEFRITDENGKRIGSCNVVLRVEHDPHPDDTTDGDTEPFINRITALLQEITEEHAQAVEDIEAGRTTALDDIGTARTGALSDIGTAKTDAIDAITADVERAETAADNAEADADRAEQAASTAGYMFFYIDSNGDLIYQRTPNTQVDFYLNNGDLYVTPIGG